jgi:AGZA family xanthine/uracil permease-like MFS transporter
VLACVPALAQLAIILIDNLLGDPIMREKGVSMATLVNQQLVDNLTTVRMLANGFIITSLLWASALAAIIDRRLWRAACLFLVCAAFTAFGIMHSPIAGSPMLLPWQLDDAIRHHVVTYLVGYIAVAVILYAWGAVLPVEDAESLEDS